MTEGDYIYHEDENLESYLNATGDSMLMKYMDTYKMHVSKHGAHLFIIERYGDLATCSNTIELEIDSPYLIPGDKKGTNFFDSSGFSVARFRTLDPQG